MDFSKLKIELYDFFGILIPGLILSSDFWIAAVGWQGYVATVEDLSGTLIAAVLAVSYVAGHLVQEAGDILVHAVTQSRYLKTARDKFWAEEDGRTVRDAIKQEVGFEINSVDVAYDYCLSKAKHLFAKRDAFIATSDLARSFVFLTVPTAITAVISIAKAKVVGWHLILDLAGVTFLFAIVIYVSWRRMMRFRDFSDRPVFSAYLATLKAVRDSHSEELSRKTTIT